MALQRWALALVVLFLLGGCASQTSDPEPGPTALAHDGVYRGAPADADEDYWYYLRFYPDGAVIAVSTAGDVDQIQDWFSRDNDGLPRGTYRLRDDRLTFETESEYGVVEYEGRVEDGGERLQLNSHSRINGFRASRTYQFHPW